MPFFIDKYNMLYFYLLRTAIYSVYITCMVQDIEVCRELLQKFGCRKRDIQKITDATGGARVEFVQWLIERADALSRCDRISCLRALTINQSRLYATFQRELGELPQRKKRSKFKRFRVEKSEKKARPMAGLFTEYQELPESERERIREAVTRENPGMPEFLLLSACVSRYSKECESDSQ